MRAPRAPIADEKKCVRRAVAYRTAIGGLVAGAAVCFVATATAKPKAKHSEAATEAFKQCREREKKGPAPRQASVKIAQHYGFSGEASFDTQTRSRHEGCIRAALLME